MNTSQIVRDILKQENLRQTDLQIRLGYTSQARISQILKGDMPLSTVIKILKALNYDLIATKGDERYVFNDDAMGTIKQMMENNNFSQTDLQRRMGLKYLSQINRMLKSDIRSSTFVKMVEAMGYEAHIVKEGVRDYKCSIE